MSRNKTILLAVFTVILGFMSISCSAAKNLTGSQSGQTTANRTKESTLKKEVLEVLVPKYAAWNGVEINGKLKMSGLPLSPSLRIYMQQGSRISMSIRVPLLGEVGRIEIDGDSLVAVNKMKGTYVEASLTNALLEYPGLLSDVQSVLLGRVVVLQKGELNRDNANGLGFSSYEQPFPADGIKRWQLTYPAKGEADDYRYTYIVNSRAETEELKVELLSKKTEISLDTEYNGESRNVAVAIKRDAKVNNFILALDSPNFNVSPMAPLRINPGWQRVSFSQFIKGMI